MGYLTEIIFCLPEESLYFFKVTLFLFTYILAVLVLPCFVQVFSNYGKWGYLGCGAQASYCDDFSCCRAQALGKQALGVVAHGLNSRGSWA